MRLLTVLLFVLFASSAYAAKTVLVLGDSLSAGFGIARDAAWPSLLAKRIAGDGWQVMNASISGETSSGGRTRLPTLLAQHKPSIVILVLGANDGLRGLPLTQMHDNLASMVAASQAVKARVLLVGMRLPPNYGPDYTQQFAQTYADLARQKKLPLVPFLLEFSGDRRDLFQNDQFHPTAQAQPLILDNLWPTLKPLLK